MEFNDTKLLRHPTVERAYEELQILCEACGIPPKMENHMFRLAVRAGETISQQAMKPEPDAVAAGLLQGFMLETDYSVQDCAQRVGVGVAQCLRVLSDGTAMQAFQEPAIQQVILARAINLTQDWKENLAKPHIELREIKEQLQSLRKTFDKFLEQATEAHLAINLEAELTSAEVLYKHRVHQRHTELDFDKSGLPDHPTIRQAYNLFKDDDLSRDPNGERVPFAASVAKIIVKTGASSDPDVIGAAILGDYNMPSVADSTYPEDEDAFQDLHRQAKRQIAQIFSPRLSAIHADSQSFHAAEDADWKPSTPEGRIVLAATRLARLESKLELYHQNPHEANGHSAAINYLKPTLAETMEMEGLPAGLMSRMKETLKKADGLSVERKIGVSLPQPDNLDLN